MDHPAPLLEIRVDVLDPPVPLSAACAGYEQGRWRCRELSRHVLQWLPEFALKYSEWQDLSSADAVLKVAEAARAVYKSERFARRGEFGEILLHILLRQHVGTAPAISKIFFKDHRNDTVKGFDAVHILEEETIELWLGEVKFYNDLRRAVRDVIAELREHTDTNYLRSEFVAITNKLDDKWPLAEDLRQMLPRTRSLDEIFSEICIPVLLTYDSPTVQSHSRLSDEYEAAFRKEVCEHWEHFREALPDLPLRVHLFLLPLEEKARLVEEMHKALNYAQELI